MIPEPTTFVGLDVSPELTLLGSWTAGGAPLYRLPSTWPLRARLDYLTAIAGRLGTTAARSVCPDPVGPAAMLVALGTTPLETACEWAEPAGLKTVILPACACALWSEGVIAAGAIREYAHLLAPPAAVKLDHLRDRFADIMERASSDLQRSQREQDDSVLDRFVDLRYGGGAETITLPVESLTDRDRLLLPFHAAHQARFGWSDRAAPVEVLAVRARCIVSPLYPLDRSSLPGAAESAAPPGWKEDRLPGGQRAYRRERRRPEA